jgi:hypothetical protein
MSKFETDQKVRVHVRDIGFNSENPHRWEIVMDQIDCPYYGTAKFYKPLFTDGLIVGWHTTRDAARKHVAAIRKALRG